MEADWFEPIRAYCERRDAAFWAEPLNALSNGGFLIAALFAAARESRAPRRDPAALALAAITAFVGIGSFLFHTFANRWSLLADIVPIGVFIYAYFLLAMRRFFDLPTIAALAATLAFAAFHLGLAPALDASFAVSTQLLSNGSVGYLPAVLALAGVGAGLRLGAGRASRSASDGVLAVFVLFLISLGFRTIDRAVCPMLPVGTHALWHLLNAGVLYGLIVVAIRFRQAGA